MSETTMFDALSSLANTLAGRVITEEIPATQQERIRIAAALGYIDSRLVVFMHDTYGLPIDISLDRARTDHNLKPDWGGLEAELQSQKGMSENNAKAQVSFIRRDYNLVHGE